MFCFHYIQKHGGFAVKDIHSCFLSRLRQKNLYYEGHGHGRTLIHQKIIEDSTKDSAPSRRPFSDPEIQGVWCRLAHWAVHRHSVWLIIALCDSPLHGMVFGSRPLVITGFSPIFKELDPHQRGQNNKSLYQSRQTTGFEGHKSGTAFSAAFRIRITIYRASSGRP